MRRLARVRPRFSTPRAGRRRHDRLGGGNRDGQCQSFRARRSRRVSSCSRRATRKARRRSRRKRRHFASSRHPFHRRPPRRSPPWKTPSGNDAPGKDKPKAAYVVSADAGKAPALPAATGLTGQAPALNIPPPPPAPAFDATAAPVVAPVITTPAAARDSNGRSGQAAGPGPGLSMTRRRPRLHP